MKKVIAVAVAIILSIIIEVVIQSRSNQAMCYIDMPGGSSLSVFGEVLEMEDGAVEIKTQERTYQTHITRVVIIRGEK